MSEGDKYDLSVPGLHKAAYSSVKIFLRTFPIAGPTLSEAFESVFASPSQRRRDEVLMMLADGFGRLGIDVDDLKQRVNESETLYDTMVFAIPAAIRTADEGKRAFLRNAVLNTALGNFEESKREMFLLAIDSLTTLHVRVLACMKDPIEWIKASGRSRSRITKSSTIDNMLSDAFPEFREDPTLLRLAYNDLVGRWFIEANDIHTQVGQNAYRNATFPLGREFLAFISEPPELQKSGETPDTDNHEETA